MNHSDATYIVYSTEIDFFVICFAWKDYAVTTVTISGVHTSCGKLTVSSS